MKKGLWMLLAGLMTLGASVSAFASARLDSMAADARQVGDIDLIWLYPNLVVNYKNTADFRLSTDGTYGDGSNEWGGALVGVNPDFGVLGVYVNRPEVELSTSANDGLWNFPLLSMLAFDQTGTGTLFITPYENQVDLFWGKNISGGNIGVHFNYGTGDDADYARDVYSLDAGLGLDNVGPFGVLNLHASYALNNLTDPSDPNDKSTGVFSATFGALASSDLDAENGIRIFTDANFDGYKAAEAPLALDLGYWGVDLGGSFNRKIDGGKGLLSTGLTLGYSSFTLWSTIPDGYA
ncbi:MAG: hypothetical protein ACREL1_00530, partial [bacterium]